MKPKRIFGLVIGALFAVAMYYAGYRLYTDGDSRYPNKLKSIGKVVSFKPVEGGKKTKFLAQIEYDHVPANVKDTVEYNRLIVDTTKTRIGKEFVVWYPGDYPGQECSFSVPGDNFGEAIVAFVLGGVMTLAVIFLLVIELRKTKS